MPKNNKNNSNNIDVGNGDSGRRSPDEISALENISKTLKDFSQNTKDSIMDATSNVGSFITAELTQSPILMSGVTIAKSLGTDLLNVISTKEDEAEKLNQAQHEEQEETTDVLERVHDEVSGTRSAIERMSEGNTEKEREAATQNERMLDALEGLKGEGSEGGDDELDFDTSSKGIFAGIMSALGISKFLSSITGATKGIFNAVLGTLLMAGKAVAKVGLMALKKIFLPAAIIASLFSGVKAAFSTWEDTEGEELGTRIMKTLRDFTGAILETLTLGLLSKETFASFTDTVASFIPTITESLASMFSWVGKKVGSIVSLLADKYNEHVIQPIKDSFVGMANFFEIDMDPIKEFFEEIPKMFDNLVLDLFDILPDSWVPDSILERINKRKEDEEARLKKEEEESKELKKLDRLRMKKKMEAAEEEQRKIEEARNIMIELSKEGETEKVKEISAAFEKNDADLAYQLSQQYRMSNRDKGLEKAIYVEDTKNDIEERNRSRSREEITSAVNATQINNNNSTVVSPRVDPKASAPMDDALDAINRSYRP